MIRYCLSRLQHRLTLYCLADYRDSRFDNYTWALIACFFVFMGFIYL